MYIVQRYLPGNGVYPAEWVDIKEPQRSAAEAKQLGIDALQSGEFGVVDKFRIVNVLEVVSRR
jgi:hypothetical protein